MAAFLITCYFYKYLVSLQIFIIIMIFVVEISEYELFGAMKIPTPTKH